MARNRAMVAISSLVPLRGLPQVLGMMTPTPVGLRSFINSPMPTSVSTPPGQMALQRML